MPPSAPRQNNQRLHYHLRVVPLFYLHTHVHTINKGGFTFGVFRFSGIFVLKARVYRLNAIER